jgi:hypothetical protein
LAQIFLVCRKRWFGVASAAVAKTDVVEQVSVVASVVGLSEFSGSIGKLLRLE